MEKTLHKQPSTRSHLRRLGAIYPKAEDLNRGFVADGARTVGRYALRGIYSGVGILQGAYEKLTTKTESALGRTATCECVQCECEPCECN